METSPALISSRTRDETEQGRLAAAGGSDQHHELAVRDLDIDAVKDFRGPERLSDPGDVDTCHAGSPYPFTAPAVIPLTM